MIFHSATETAVLIFPTFSAMTDGLILQWWLGYNFSVAGMTVTAVLASLIPILWESGIGSDVMKPIAAPIVGGMITSTTHVLTLVPVFVAFMKERALRQGTLRSYTEDLTE